MVQKYERLFVDEIDGLKLQLIPKRNNMYRFAKQEEYAKIPVDQWDESTFTIPRPEITEAPKMGALMSGLVGGIAGGIEITFSYPVEYIKTVM